LLKKPLQFIRFLRGEKLKNQPYYTSKEPQFKENRGRSIFWPPWVSNSALARQQKWARLFYSCAPNLPA
jgi:hypothetical protein